MLLPLTLLFAVQTAAGDTVRPKQPTAELAALLRDASEHNRAVPKTLHSYRASVESELAIIARRPEGVEGAVSIEQMHSEVWWDRTGAFRQHVTGYRSQSLGLNISALSFIRNAWAVPVLYGNRITLLFGRDTMHRRPDRTRRPVVAVHPLADDRDRVYRYSGGDTVVMMRVNGRDIPIVRVFVEPRADAPRGTVAFAGELDIDPTRHALVRMKGHFVTPTPKRSLVGRLMTIGSFHAVAFVELENAEFDGAYWLPIYQRIEAQAGWTALTDGRSIFRIASRFRNHRLNDGPAPVITEGTADSLRVTAHRLTVADGDTLSRFSAWNGELGAATSAVHSDDFEAVAPDVWRQTGGPRFGWHSQRVLDVVHFNRVEGLYTGVAGELRFRDAAPGLTVRGTAGWAWQEETVRGRLSAEWQRGARTWSARAGRALDLTNDFRSPFDSGATLGPLLLTADPYDYVDRRSAAVGFTQALGRGGRTALIRAETGPATDRMAHRHVSRGIIRPDSNFRENRGVRGGSYWRNRAAIEWHPDVNAEFMRTGVGATLSAEQAWGELDYTRVEARLMARLNEGAWTFAVRTDGGVVLGGAPPPQQLFELGRNQNLSGYEDKEFAGTQAVVARSLVMYRLPILRAPLRVGRYVLPALSPSLAGGVQSAWAAVEGGGGEAALRELGVVRGADGVTRPVSRETDGVRTSTTVGLRFFGGALGIGAARALDRPARWRLVVDLAQLL